MIFEVDDSEQFLIARIASLINEHNREISEKARIRSMSYEERLQEFLEYVGVPSKELGGIGLCSWYEVEIHRKKYSYKELDLPIFCQFRQPELHKYFFDGEDKPCVMRGAIHSMKVRFNKKWTVTKAVIERYLRRTKFTCLLASEWRDILDSKAARALMKRLDEKWDGGTGAGGAWLHDLVHDRPTGRMVLINGELTFVENDMLKLIDKLYLTYKKLGNQEAAKKIPRT
jgi:hypothetical protein